MGKAMRAMKKKSVSKIAKGRYAKSVVFRGTKAKTVGGLAKGDLIKNKRGKIVSKKAVAHGKKAFANIKAWTVADQDQEGQDREQEGCCPRQEVFREHQGLDRCRS